MKECGTLQGLRRCHRLLARRCLMALNRPMVKVVEVRGIFILAVRLVAWALSRPSRVVQLVALALSRPLCAVRLVALALSRPLCAVWLVA